MKLKTVETEREIEREVWWWRQTARRREMDEIVGVVRGG